MRAAKLLCEKSKSQIPAFKSPVGVGCIMPVILSCLPFQTDGVTKQKITRLIQNDNSSKKTHRETNSPKTILLKNPRFIYDFFK